MKLLLTSNGITNDTLATALEQLVGKAFHEIRICFIPTAAFADPSPQDWLIRDQYRLIERGATVYVASLAELPTDELTTQLAQADVILVGGGNTFYLSYMMEQKGLFQILPKLLDGKVYVGISAGSIIATPTLRTTSQSLKNEDVSDDALSKLGPEHRSSAKTLHLVPFALRPHLNRHCVAEINGGALERIATKTNTVIYAIEDSVAVMVDGDTVTVVGEGEHRVIHPKAS